MKLKIREISMEALTQQYDALMFDAYGVLVSRQGMLPGVREVLTTLNERRIPWWIVSNGSSRPQNAYGRYFRDLGMPVKDDQIVVSGALLTPFFAERDLVGQPTLTLGPEGSRELARLAGGCPVSPGEDFSVLVIGNQTGFHFPDDWDLMLTTLIGRIESGKETTLIVPNPDLIFPRGEGRWGVTSGALGRMLEDILHQRFGAGNFPEIHRLGKPHRPVFVEARRRAGTDSVAMLGDQLDTDIRGAKDFGIDAVLVKGGVTPVDSDRLADCPPDWILQAMSFDR